MGRLSIHN